MFALLQVPELVDKMSSRMPSPKFLLDGIYKTSVEAIDRSIIDDYNVCELDFLQPLPDWQPDLLESVATDYPSASFPSPSSSDLVSSDLLPQCQIIIYNEQPSQQEEESIVLHSAVGIHGNWNDLGLSFGKKNDSAFVKWKAVNPDLPRYCKQKKYWSLQKRCIGFLNDINNHKTLRPPSYNNNCGEPSVVISSSYDKLAIQHVVAERKRREQMSDVFSVLRALVPVKPKNASRATVLLRTKDYVIELKRNIKQLSERNRELEELLFKKS
eukprot:PITA_34367